MITLKWHGDMPDLDLDQLEITVLKDIKQSLNSLDKPSDLIFHTVFLGEDYDGPNVAVWGENDDDSHFHCQYYTDAQWVSINEESANA